MASRRRREPTAGSRWTSPRRPREPQSRSTRLTVDYESEGRVAVVTLNRARADNAITTEMGEPLTDILETIAVRRAVRVVIITGSGNRASPSAATSDNARA